MGIIKARNLKYDYIKYDENGQPSEIHRAVDEVKMCIRDSLRGIQRTGSRSFSCRSNRRRNRR